MQEATDYAQQRAEVFKNELQFLIDKQNEEKKNAQQLVTQNYENMINQLNQGRVPIEQQYQENARQAYVNKMLAGKQMDSELTRLGLDTTGFALSQKISNENQYSANLNQLALDRAAGLRGIDDKITNAQGQLAADLLKTNIDYDARMNQLNQYINEQVEQKYADEYARFMQNRQYEDQLRQQEIENQQNWAKINNTYINNNNPFAGGNDPEGTITAEDLGKNDVAETRVMGTVASARNLGFDIGNLPVNGTIREYQDAKGNLYYLVYDDEAKHYLDITEDWVKFKDALQKISQDPNAKHYANPNYTGAQISPIPQSNTSKFAKGALPASNPLSLISNTISNVIPKKK